MYACRFDLPLDKGLEWPRSAYQDWLARRYGLPYDQLEENLPKRHSISVSKYEVNSDIVEIITWAFPHDDDDELLWRNSIRLCKTDSLVSLEHTIWIDSLDFRVAPVRLAIGSPKVIRRLCAESSVRVGDIDVKATPYRINSGDIDALIDLLESPRRRIPIVFLSPSSTGIPNRLDANLLAQNLAGIAIIVQPTTADVTWELSERAGRLRSCFAGAARIYWPGFSIHSDPRAHPLFLGGAIDREGEKSIAQQIERSIFTVACFRFAPDHRIDTVMREAERKIRQEIIVEKKENEGLDWESYAFEIDGKLTESNKLVSELQSEISNLRDNQAVLLAYQPEASAEIPVSEREINSMEDAVAFASEDLNHLTILDSARKSAERSPFGRPGDIYDALGDIDSVAQQFFKNGGDIKGLLTERGWGKRCSMHISATTKSRFGNSYTFNYGGSDKLFEPHITLGAGNAASCASIHFFIDNNIKKFVIGHVGEHLPNTKTN